MYPFRRPPTIRLRPSVCIKALGEWVGQSFAFFELAELAVPPVPWRLANCLSSAARIACMWRERKATEKHVGATSSSGAKQWHLRRATAGILGNEI